MATVIEQEFLLKRDPGPSSLRKEKEDRTTK